MAITPTFGGRPGDRLHVPGCGTRSVRRQRDARREVGPAVPPVLQVVSFLVQDLERGDGGRKHLHVAAGGSDDFARGCARGRLYALAEERRTATGARCRFRDRQPPECPRTRRIDAIDIPAGDLVPFPATTTEFQQPGTARSTLHSMPGSATTCRPRFTERPRPSPSLRIVLLLGKRRETLGSLTPTGRITGGCGPRSCFSPKLRSAAPRCPVSRCKSRPRRLVV